MWKDIPSCPGYQASDSGEIRSLDRVGPDGRRLKGRILSPGQAGKGYLKVTPRINNKSRHRYVHILVMEAFVGPANSLVVNHKNGDKKDNRLDNLEYVTYGENNQHAYDTNLKGRGEKQYNAKLTESQVQEIKRNGKGYYTYQELGDKYGVSKATIRDILIGKTWKFVDYSNDYPQGVDSK